MALRIGSHEPVGHRPRCYEPGYIYHLIARGVRGQPIFLARTDHDFFLFLLSRCLIEAGHPLLGYCLMPNHVHLLAECGPGGLSGPMRGLLHGYASYLNRRLGQGGHVFQGRHRARLCTDEAYLRALFRYIHLNPVRAGLADQAADYPWSSLGAYLGQRSPVKVSTGLVREVLGLGRGRPAARRLLELLGSAAAPDELWTELDAYVGLDELPSAPPLSSAARPTLRQLADRVARETAVPGAEIMGRVELGRARSARRRLVELAVREHGYSLEEVATGLGRSRQAVARCLRG